MKQEIKELMQGKSLNFIAKIQDKLSEKFEKAKAEMKIEVGNSMLKEESIDEKLHGKQHKLDHDEDGDIDAKDMKDVRKKGPNNDHPMAEESLDEVSKGLMGRYIKKAADKALDHAHKYGKKQSDSDEVDRFTNRHGTSFADRDNMKKMLKATEKDKDNERDKMLTRYHGVAKATDKLTGQAKVPAK